MKKRPLSIAFFASLTAVVAPGVAHATKVAPLVPEVKPNSPPAGLLDKFQDAVEKGARQSAKYDVLPAREERAAVVGKPDLAGCHWGACVPAVSGALQVDGVILTTIEQTGRRYQISVSIFDSTGRELIKPVEERCDICTQREVENTLAKAARAALDAAPATISVTPVAVAPPPKAEDDTKPEPVPEFAKDEKLPMEDETARPRPSDQTESKLPHWPYMTAAFGVAAAALVATGVFGYYASKEDQGTCGLADPQHSCPQIYHGNAAPTIAFGITAGLAAAAGVGLLVWDLRANDKKQHKGTNVSVLPAPGGIYAGAGFEF